MKQPITATVVGLMVTCLVASGCATAAINTRFGYLTKEFKL